MPVIGKSFRRWLGIGIIIASSALLSWGLWPVSKNVRTVLVSPPGPAGGNLGWGPSLGRQPQFSLSLEWPPVLRIDDPGLVRLKMIPSSGTGGGDSDANQKDGANRLVEVRLELAGFQSIPDGEALTPLKDHQPVVLQWALRPQQPGIQQGTLWIHLRSLPDGAGQASQPESRQILSAQKLQIRTVSLMGLTGLQVRIAGIVGCVVGVLLFLETFYSNFLETPSSPSTQ